MPKYHKYKNQLVAVDLDRTLCEGEFWGEGEPKPIQKNIDKVWGLYRAGAHIVIYTARLPRYYTLTFSWLIKFGVPFHGIAMMMKPGADWYFDDKGLNINDL